MRSALIALVVVALIGAGVLYFANQAPEQVPSETKAGFTYANASEDDIVIDAPKPEGNVGKTLTVSGKARGYWYFEASFPVTIIQPSGATLLETYMQAEGDWMTTEFVPFSRSITIPGSYTGPAIMILKKDNPSGIPENDASVSFPITIQ